MIIKLYNGEIEIDFNEDTHRYFLLDKENLTKTGTPKKVSLPGVTTILGVISKPQLIPWAVETTVNYLRNNLDQLYSDPKQLLEAARNESERVKSEAGDIGKEIHDWIEKHAKGQTPEIPDNENVKRGIISFLEWEAENKVKYLENEKIVYSRKYGFVGKLDIIATINGGLYLLDIKTGNGIWQEHHAQTAAYLKADMEERGTKYDGRIILRISKETEEDYKKRMEDKAYYKKDPEKYPYKVFEAVYLDREGSTVHQDFKAFESALNIYNWQK